MTTQIIIFIIVMLGYGVAFVFKKFQEQAELKRAREQRERRKLEALRTGRMEEEDAPSVVVAAGRGAPGPASHQEATRRLQEIAERRRRQLEELRRRAMGQGEGTQIPPLVLQPPPSAQPPARVPSRPPPRPEPRSPQRPVAAPAPASRRSPMPPSRSAPARPASPAARPVTPTQQVNQPRHSPAAPTRRQAAARARESERTALAEPAAAQRRAAPAPAPTIEALLPAALPPDAHPGGPLGNLLTARGRATAAEWRRAIMLREILSPPVAMRSETRDVL